MNLEITTYQIPNYIHYTKDFDEATSVVFEVFRGNGITQEN